MQTESSGQETKATLQGWKGQGPTRGPFLPKVPQGSFLTGLDQVRPAGPRWDLIGWDFSLAVEMHHRPRQLRGLGTCLTALGDVTRSSGPPPRSHLPRELQRAAEWCGSTLSPQGGLPGRHIPQPVFQGGRATAEERDASWKSGRKAFRNGQQFI